MSAAARSALRRLLGDQGLLEEATDLRRYEHGWRYGHGKALAAARPTSPAEVAQVLALCHAYHLRVQTVGGNTGLVGATNPDSSGEQLVLSLERLNRTIEIDAIDRTVVVDAGVLLSQLNAALEPHGLWFPVDLGADPQIGGMVATNTGGTRLLRHGDVRRHLLGVEVALADGTLLSCLQRLRKNNTGLDCKQLFTGTSGTYGVITRVALQVSPRPKQRAAVLVGAACGEAVLRLLRHLELRVADVLSAYEAVSRDALEATLRHGANLRNPFSEALPAYAVLVELASTLPADRLDLEALLHEELMQHLEGEGSEDLTEVVIGPPEDFWNLRHQVSESLRVEGKVLAFDLSVPRSRLAAFTMAVRERLASSHPHVRVCDFGHWGDGGTHLNLVAKPGDLPGGPGTWEQLQDMIYRLCVEEFEGSYSAEHGVGPHNQRCYDRFTPAPVRALCAALKQALDPDGRLGTLRLGGS